MATACHVAIRMVFEILSSSLWVMVSRMRSGVGVLDKDGAEGGKLSSLEASQLATAVLRRIPTQITSGISPSLWPTLRPFSTWFCPESIWRIHACDSHPYEA